MEDDTTQGRLKGGGMYMDANDPVLSIDAFRFSISEKRDTITLKVCGPFKAGYGLPNDGETTRLLFQVDLSEQDFLADVERLKQELSNDNR